MTKKWIPNLLTVINLVAGLLAVMLAFLEQRLVASALILGAALFDSMDGRIARRLNAISEFGKELDSLADLVSFGVAPAIMAYLAVYHYMGWSGCLLTVLFPLCGALRLAYFKMAALRGYFVGLPLTAAGSILAIVTYAGQALPLAVHIGTLLLLSCLMLSTIKVPKL